uniref:Uncharacterized protein n=1 Tax=Pithovirus LCPAC403 TaxID=2506596 RepID=A0A481ZAK1_9VIRU|nr:MAG: uncharacterized protein LCPAC403_00870 [Pithovirus LCPAC403]
MKMSYFNPNFKQKKIIDFIEQNDISIIISHTIPIFLKELYENVKITGLDLSRETLLRNFTKDVPDMIVMTDAHIFDLEGLMIIKIAKKLVLISSVEPAFDANVEILDLRENVNNGVRYHGFLVSDDEVLSEIYKYTFSPSFTDGKNFILYTPDVWKYVNLLEERFNREPPEYNLDRWKNNYSPKKVIIMMKETYKENDISKIIVLSEFMKVSRVSVVFDLMTKNVPLKSVFGTKLPVEKIEINITKLEARQRAGEGICYRFCSEKHFDCLKEKDCNITLNMMSYTKLIDYGINPLLIFEFRMMVEECGLVEKGRVTPMYRFIRDSGLSLESGMVLWKCRDNESVMLIASVETLTKPYEYFNFPKKYGQSDSDFLVSTNKFKLNLLKRYSGRDDLETVNNVLNEESKREPDTSDLKRPESTYLDDDGRPPLELLVSNNNFIIPPRHREYNVRKIRLNAVISLYRYLLRYVKGKKYMNVETNIREEYWNVGELDDTEITNVTLLDGGDIPIFGNYEENFTISKYSVTSVNLDRPLRLSILNYVGGSVNNLLVP